MHFRKQLLLPTVVLIAPSSFSALAQLDSVDPASFSSTSFDVIIVGGGTAGLVLANRLSATSLRVGVVDAGHYNTTGDPLIDVPYSPGYLINDPSASAIGNPAYDWAFSSIPQDGLLNGTVIPYPRGKVLGGSSAINNLAWQRGAREEYDSWSTTFENGPRWSFDALETFFKRSENWTFPATGSDALAPNTTASQLSALAAAHGEGGPIDVRYDNFVTEIDRAFAQASVNMGFPLNPNPDGGNSSFIPLAGIPNSVDISSGKRSYAAPGYYSADIRVRPNLSVLMHATVSRIIWDDVVNNDSARATGVEFVAGGQTYVANATQEVIVCAGTLKSPQVLELSGVGNATLLESLGIPVVLNLPQVGENLMDHILTSTDYTIKDGVFSLDWLRTNQTYLQEQQALYNSTGQGAFTYATRVTGSWPVKDIVSEDQYARMRASLDAELAALDLTPLQLAQYAKLKDMLDSGEVGWVTPIALPRGGAASIPIDDENYITVAVFQMHEFSRGSVHISTSNSSVPPQIDPKFLSFTWDLDVQVAAAQFIRRWVNTEPAASYIADAVTPPANVDTDDKWRSFVLSTLGSIAHPIGTMPMAPKAMGGVVGSDLKIYGLANVRVVDASVIPLTIGAPLQPTVYAVAENAASIIMKDLGATSVH